MKQREEKAPALKTTIAIRVAFISILAAMAIGGNFALAVLPNVELSSVMVFLSGFLFGSFMGAFVGLISMTIYQVWNPWGAFIPPIGLAVIACTMFTGIIGGFLGQSLRNRKNSDRRWFILPALFGIQTTLLFDLVTNFVYSLSFGIPFSIALITGLPFTFIHIISNALLFGILTHPVSDAVNKLQSELLNPNQSFATKTNTSNYPT
ncbi:MAG: ECF transporter S component [Candidatus Thorarchaeota archaeon]